VSNDIKVTDKRIFTPEGDLREEYRFLDEKSTAAGEAAEAAPPAAVAAPPPAPEPPHAAPDRGPDPGMGHGYEPAPAVPGFDLPGGPAMEGERRAGFFDLAAMLAEPAALYLGDVPLPDGQFTVDLEMARLHIDLLDTLRQKTAGNLTAQEATFVEDLLYRLKVRYVQKMR
jgi:hypothetical protein